MFSRRPLTRSDCRPSCILAHEHMLKKFDSKEKLYNCNSVNRFSTSINTPVLEASSVRSAHLDNLNKLFTGLFYMKQDDDKSTGGDLELYSWNKNISNVKKTPEGKAMDELDIKRICCRRMFLGQTDLIDII